MLMEVYLPCPGPCIKFQVPHLEKRASQSLAERACSLGLKPGRQAWKDWRLLANKAQIEARVSDRSQG